MDFAGAQERYTMNDFKRKLQREKSFHDKWASKIDVEALNVDAVFEGATVPENRYILSKLGPLRGRYVLDLGCGAGESSVYFARHGARCVAGDSSQGMLATAGRLAKLHGVNIECQVIDAMQIGFDSNVFDIVYAANVLHHVDVECALREIHRVLKPGGVAGIWDPLKHNPVINIYRRMATKVRTDDEHPLDIKVVEQAKQIFSKVEYDCFWLATLWIFLRFYLIERIHPNEVRYWKKILTDELRLRRTYYRLEKLDYLLKKISYAKRFAWNIAIVAQK
jgi:ubiquinone/menaquinone biosynthesis C-methylase UbiE